MNNKIAHWNDWIKLIDIDWILWYYNKVEAEDKDRKVKKGYDIRKRQISSVFCLQLWSLYISSEIDCKYKIFIETVRW